MEEREVHEIHQSMCKKDVISFRTWYVLMERPIDVLTIFEIVTYAIKEGFVSGLRTLIKENGIGCLIFSEYGYPQQNAFTVACKYGQVEIVKFLLGVKDCDKVLPTVNYRNKDGLSIAIENENEELCEVLLGSGLFHIDKIPCSSLSRLFHALSSRKEEEAHFLITHGADVTFAGHNEYLGMISCVCLSAIEVPSLLIDILKRGGDPNDVHEKTNKSVLQLALQAQVDRKTVEAIIRSGADLNFRKNPLIGLNSLGTFNVF